MKVALFSGFDASLNPYILLFKETLERQNITVQLERDFSLKWVLSSGKTCDCIHLHWINLSSTFSSKERRSYWYTRLIKSRFVGALLDVIRLIDFSLAILCSKLKGKIIVFTVHDLFRFGKESWRWIVSLEIARSIVFLLSDSIHVHNHFPDTPCQEGSKTGPRPGLS